MRISDWSSDVCSSDLADDRRAREVRNRAPEGCDRAVQARFERRSWERCRHGMAFALLHAPAPICRGREADESGAGDGADERRSADGLRQAAARPGPDGRRGECLRSEEHTSELQSLMRISYAVFCLKKKN